MPQSKSETNTELIQYRLDQSEKNDELVLQKINEILVKIEGIEKNINKKVSSNSDAIIALKIRVDQITKIGGAVLMAVVIYVVQQILTRGL